MGDSLNVDVLGVVVPVYRQVAYTEKFIESLLKQKPYNIKKIILVVVDNAYEKETLEVVNSAMLQAAHLSSPDIIIQYLPSDKNLGYGVGANLGIKYLYQMVDPAATLDFLICNNDMELLDGCFMELSKMAHSSKEIGIVGGKLLFPDEVIQHAGAFLGPFGWGQHKQGAGKNGRTIPREFAEEQEYVTGALFYVKGDLMKLMGGFDERFSPAYFEEVDFCFSARKKGYTTVYTPFAKAIHYENVTGKAILGDPKNIKKLLSDVNQVKFYKKLNEERSEYTSDSADKILLTCKIYGDWSFSGVMRNLAKGLKRAGVDVAIAPEEYHNKGAMSDWEIKEMIDKPHNYWDRVVLRSCEGDHMYLMPPGKKRIAHTTGESTRVSNEWVEQLNHVDLVLTTSNFYKGVLVNGGVQAPVEVLPNSVNLSLFNKNIEKLPLTNLRAFNFFSMFHFGERKAPEILIKAFIEEFTPEDDVALTIHSLSMGYVLQSYGMDIKQWVASISGKAHAPIFVSQTPQREDMLPHYMRNFDCFVLPTRAEGFGLPVLECGALGIPSIVTGHSGVLDIVEDNETGWLIDNKLVDIPLQYLPYFKNYIGGQWAEASVEHLRELMRYAVNHPEEVKLKGQNAYLKALDFSIENVGLKAKELIFK